jgi:hypothetical protein
MSESLTAQFFTYSQIADDNIGLELEVTVSERKCIMTATEVE